ncbi:MAG: MerR family transcriptional regulator [Chloroflexi bacterium]|nr:MerR family transcriptional regulator [Chloroflexota bacterium]
MIRIGDFSKLSQVTVKALRLYDERGLLRPARVDDFTGYRYYSADQLPRLNRILALKDLGFSLEQIAQLLKDDLLVEQLRGMLKMKRAEIEQRLEDEQERLARVEARLRQIERENEMSNYEIVIKKIEPVRVAAVRDTIPAYSQQGGLWNELYAQVGQYGAQFAGPALTVYYDEEYKERDVDVEVCQPIHGSTPAHGRVKVHDLPGGAMASAVHNGAYNRIGQAYEAITRWVEANGYKIAGPIRELYLRASQPVRQDDESCVTEIQFPVEKV